MWIEAAPDVVYAIAADPEQLPRWASGLAEGGLRQTADGWVADSPMGEVTVEFAPANEYGVLDHVVRMPSGEAVYNPLRVIPAGEGQRRCEVRVHGASAAGHDRRGVRKRRGDGGRRPGPAAAAGGGLAARAETRRPSQATVPRRPGKHGGRRAGGDEADRDQHERTDNSAISLYTGQARRRSSTSSGRS